MKSLTQSIKESIQSRIDEAKINPKDEKLFWKWIEDLGETDMMSKIQEEESGKPLYIKASELGTTGEQFELFCDIFF